MKTKTTKTTTTSKDPQALPPVPAGVISDAKLAKAQKFADKVAAEMTAALNTPAGKAALAKVVAPEAKPAKKLTAWQRIQAEAMSTPEKKESAKLVAALVDAGMSKAEIAEALGCDQAIVYSMSKGYSATKLEALRGIKPVVNKLDAPKRAKKEKAAQVTPKEAKDAGLELTGAGKAHLTKLERAAEEAAEKSFTPKAGRKMQIIPVSQDVGGAIATLKAAANKGEKVTIGSLKVPTTRAASAKLAKILGMSQADLEAAGQLTFIW